MKVGILTLPLHINYGGILQAYALQKTLKDMGHEAILIDVQGIDILKRPLWKRLLSYTKRIVFKYFLVRKDTIIFQERKRKKEWPIISREITPFIRQYIEPRITPFRLDELKPDLFDAIVVGSDQIWRPKLFPDIEDAFLFFAKEWDIKRVSYAPSFGVDYWEYSKIQTDTCRELLSSFNAISIREDSGVRLCKEHLNAEALLVLDPTMLLKISDYERLIVSAKTIETNGELLTYILDFAEDEKEKDDIISYLSKQFKYSPYSVGHIRFKNPLAPLEDCISPSVEQWLRGFYEAKFVITDSFHACVFSILFHKPFVVFANKKRGIARLESLLAMFGLEDRIVTTTNDIEKMENLTNVDWDRVDKLHVQLQQKSKTFLEEALNN